jgi:hypothetical protein
MKNYTTFCLLVGLVAVSCQRSEFTSEIKTIDSLIAVLDSAEAIFADIDTTGFRNLGQTFTENMSYVEQHYKKNNDTIPRDVALLMANYRDIKKPAKGFLSNHSKIKGELEYSKQQLRDLKHDLENNLLERNFVDRMVNQEKEAIDKVKGDVSTIKMSEKYTNEKLSKVGPQVDSLILVLKNQAQ